MLAWLSRVEQMEAAFYAEAEDRGALKGELAEFARLVGRQERAHADALEKALGGTIRPSAPEFDFKDVTGYPDRSRRRRSSWSRSPWRPSTVRFRTSRAKRLLPRHGDRLGRGPPRRRRATSRAATRPRGPPTAPPPRPRRAARYRGHRLRGVDDERLFGDLLSRSTLEAVDQRRRDRRGCRRAHRRDPDRLPAQGPSSGALLRRRHSRLPRRPSRASRRRTSPS